MTSTRVRVILVLASVSALVIGCSSSTDDDAASATESPTTTTEAPAAPTTTTAMETGSVELGSTERPASLVAPDDVTAPAPLLVLLHGYTSNAAQQDGYLGVTEQAASRGLYVLLPNGTIGPGGNTFWDATPACCNFSGTPVDDVGYLRSLIAEAIEKRPIDPDRVYVFGHSNGGFMAYRLACEAADEVTAIAVLAGSEMDDASECVPARPVSVLHLHGDADELIIYTGGSTTAPFPGAQEVMARWAGRDRCSSGPVAKGRLDLDTGLAGSETSVQVFEGCDDGSDVQLDTIEGGHHVPALSHDRVGTEVLDWLLDHTR